MPQVNLRFARPWHSQAFELLRNDRHSRHEIARRCNVSVSEVAGMIASFRSLSRRTHSFYINTGYQIGITLNEGITLGASTSTTSTPRVAVDPASVSYPTNLNYLMDLISGTFTFGCEFEIASSIDRNQMKTQLSRLDLINSVVLTDSSHAENHDVWSIQHDSSVSGSPGHRYAMEIASPILKGRDGLLQLFKVVTFLKTVARVNGTCGGHVHHGTFGNNLEVAKGIWKIYKANEDLVDTLVNPDRRNGHQYTAELRNSTWESCLHHKYYKLSFRNFCSNGTFENRHLQGCLDFERLANWIILTQRIIKRARAGETLQTRSLVDLLCQLIPDRTPTLDSLLTWTLAEGRIA